MNFSISVRRPSPKEIEGFELDPYSSNEEFLDNTGNPVYICLYVQEEKGEELAGVSKAYFKDTNEISVWEYIEVKENHRRKGIGYLLSKETFILAKEEGVDFITAGYIPFKSFNAIRRIMEKLKNEKIMRSYSFKDPFEERLYGERIPLNILL